MACNVGYGLQRELYEHAISTRSHSAGPGFQRFVEAGLRNKKRLAYKRGEVDAVAMEEMGALGEDGYPLGKGFYHKGYYCVVYGKIAQDNWFGRVYLSDAHDEYEEDYVEVNTKPTHTMAERYRNGSRTRMDEFAYTAQAALEEAARRI